MSEDINVGAISEALNNKMDRDGMNAGNPACVITETYHDNNGNWYRVYSDGWCEQGGYSGASGSGNNNTAVVDVNLIIPFKDTNYIAFANVTTNGGSAWANRLNEAYSTTMFKNSGWVVGSSTITVHTWEAKGYIR